MKISVIVPTFNDGELLKKCIEALNKQTYPKEDYEIIVVNNSKNDLSISLDDYPRVRCLVEVCPGSYSARNKGITSSEADILAFTDADCIPSPNWLEEGIKQFSKNSNCSILVGKIEVFFRNPLAPSSVELYEKAYAFPQKSYVEKQSFGVTANIFSKRSLFEKIGLFEHTLKSGGDLEWCQRAKKAGFEIHYSDRVCVSHPARYTFNEIHQKTTRVIKGHYSLVKQGKISKAKFLFISFVDFLIPVWPVFPLLFGKNSQFSISEKIQISKVTVAVRFVKGFERLKLLFSS